MRFSSFSSTRYGGLARTSQHLLACHLLGVGSLIAHVRDSKADEFYLQGYDRFQNSLPLLVGSAALAAPTHQRVLNIVSNDDRLCRHVLKIDHALQSALSWVLSLNDFTFSHVANAMGVDKNT